MGLFRAKCVLIPLSVVVPFQPASVCATAESSTSTILNGYRTVIYVTVAADYLWQMVGMVEVSKSMFRVWCKCWEFFGKSNGKLVFGIKTMLYLRTSSKFDKRIS